MKPSPIVARPRVFFRSPGRARMRGGARVRAVRGIFPRSVLALGGCRSGKTAWAEAAGLELARNMAGGQRPRLIYIATALAGDDPAMQARIARHQTLRDPAWQTLEAPFDLPEALAKVMSQISDADGGADCGPGPGAGCGADPGLPPVVLIDCVTVWLANLMAAGHDDRAILERAERLAALLRQPACPVFVISNETGLGVAPSTALGNLFRDIAGLVNQTLVKSCDEVYFIVSGLAQKLKSVPEPSARCKFRPCRGCT